MQQTEELPLIIDHAHWALQVVWVKNNVFSSKYYFLTTLSCNFVLYLCVNLIVIGQKVYVFKTPSRFLWNITSCLIFTYVLFCSNFYHIFSSIPWGEIQKVSVTINHFSGDIQVCISVKLHFSIYVLGQLEKPKYQIEFRHDYIPLILLYNLLLYNFLGSFSYFITIAESNYRKVKIILKNQFLYFSLIAWG